jgi:hypothetical protein
MGGLPVVHFLKRGPVMKNRLSNLKNLLWAGGILLCLTVMLVALLFAMSKKNSEPRPSGTITLGQIERGKKSGDAGIIGGETAPGILIPLPENNKGNLDTVFGMTFLCDKTILGLRTYANNYADGIIPQIWTDNETGLPVKSAADTPIVFVDGSLITAGNGAMITRPKTMVLYLGGDGLVDTTERQFIEGYIRLIDSIRSSSPSTKIIVCSIGSISSNYQGADGLTPELVARANAWIRQVCIQTGTWYADLASLLNDSNGYLSDAYLMPDGRSIAPAGIAIIVDYFRFHGVN